MYIKLSFHSDTQNFINILDEFAEQQNPTAVYRMSYLKENNLIDSFYYAKDNGNNFNFYINVIDPNNQEQVVNYFNDWMNGLINKLETVSISFEIHTDFSEDYTVYEKIGF
jgi:hypothetical protein